MRALAATVLVVALTAGIAGAGGSRLLWATVIGAGDYHTCALTASGGIACWGWNPSGQLGDGTTIRRSVPVPTYGLGSGVESMSVGGGHTCAIKAGGNVRCWGWNISGQLGRAPGKDRWIPLPVPGLESGIRAVAAGGEHTCALTDRGGVKCWGHNNFGDLGDGTRIDRIRPAGVVGLGSGVSAIATGTHHSCALTNGGGVKCWGLNDSGQLGDGTRINRLTSVDVHGLTSGVVAVSAFASHTCALTTKGGVKCWGANGSGELGNGTRVDRSTPVDVSGLPTGVRTIAMGGRHDGEGHTCVVTSGGAVDCWGANEFGELGDGTKTERLTPVQVAGIASGAAGVAVGGYHSCALMRSGSVKCWGWNKYGQLGNATTTNSSTPIDVAAESSGDCFVPRVLGRKLARARFALAKRHCRLGKVAHRHSPRPRGRVIAQAPRAGAHRAPLARVKLVVSSGSRPH